MKPATIQQSHMKIPAWVQMEVPMVTDTVGMAVLMVAMEMATTITVDINNYSRYAYRLPFIRLRFGTLRTHHIGSQRFAQLIVLRLHKI